MDGKRLFLYTREVISEDEYSPKVAYSMHLCVEGEAGKLVVLNHNSGVLFAKATENEDGSLNAKCLNKPKAVKTEDGYLIFYIRTNETGACDSESVGSIFSQYTKDFLHYGDIREWKLSDREITDYAVTYRDSDIKIYWQECDKDFIEKKQRETEISFESYVNQTPEGCVLSDCIAIDSEVANKLLCKLTTPVNIDNTVPKTVKVSGPSELSMVRAVATYSDGSSCEKRVDWDVAGIDFSQKGTVTVKGQIHKEHFEFPVFVDRADPCIARWKGKYYFIATTDEDGNHTTYVREADTIKGLETAEPVCILDSKTYDYIGGLLWAPEFHEINGRLYIFMAAANQGTFFCEECRLLTLKEGGSPINPADWSAPVRVVRKDGSELCKEGEVISLDMTCFEWQGEFYVVWSQRQFIPKDLGAWLYIAKLNPEKPWMLDSDPVVLTKPEYSFENNHTFVVEGPFALIRDDILYLTYSAALVDATYVVSMMTITQGKDLLVSDNWIKNNYPILCARSTPGEYGTGHNAYVEDEDGVIWNSYHARVGVDGPRSTGIRRVHFGFDGEPILDMHEEEDVCESKSSVSMQVEII